MFVSDMHLAAVYPLVPQYVENFDVKLIVNTGDESEFGSAAELTPAYLTSLRRVTAKVPMIWLAGNHDSPDTEQHHALGARRDGAGHASAAPTVGSYAVTGSQVTRLRPDRSARVP